MRRREIRHAIAAGLLFLGVGVAQAQTAKSITEGYEQAIKGAQTVAALGPDLFGEEVNLKDGGTSFRATDVTVKTNSGLPMSVGRMLGINGKDIDNYTDWVRDGELLGNWKLDVPYMSGTYDERTGWVSTMPNPQQRCSVSEVGRMGPPTMPSVYPNWYTTYDANQYWSGNRIHIPGKGDNPLLYLPADRSRPNDGRAYYGITKADWRVACLPALKNGTGEGFLVVLPDGTRYHFDWVSSRRVSALKDTLCDGASGGTGGCVENIVINRREYFLHATRVEDRFGNWVAYQYDAANPRQLLSITSSDGAAITLTYVGGKVDTVSTAGRTWRYEYLDANRTMLGGVVLPDGSRWSFQYGDLYWLTQQLKLTWLDCEPMPGLDDRTEQVVITHPSGARGTFAFRKLVHGTDRTPGGCYDPNPDRFGDEQISEIVMVYKAPTLISKQVTGPGLSAQTWSYAYQPSWSWNPSGYVDDCTAPANCSSTVQTQVTAPDGVITRYMFGNDYWRNAGQLLQTDIIQNAVTVQSTINTYPFDVNGQAFPDRIGVDPFGRNNELETEKLRPQLTGAISRDGATFSWQVNSGCSGAGLYCFDGFARPTSVRKFSSLGYSKNDTTSYYDHLSKWVLGQVLQQSTDGIEVARTDYDANALPWKTYSFGKLQQTLGYYADGTLATVTDGRNYTTTLSNWYRGIPRTIQHPDGTSESASVNDNGWITSVVDENGYSNGYGYDAMGRLAAMTYPANDTVAWQNVAMTFQPVPYAEGGLAAGHWRMTRSEGNRVTTTLYDALWRPVMTVDRDAALNVETQSIKRYDSSGRVGFQSYPTRNVGDFQQSLPGTRTFYDALDRVTRVEQDSELGVLATTTEYLAPFKKEVINPRGYKTRFSFAAYDQPTYDMPNGIVEAMGTPEAKATEIYRDIFGKPTALRRRNGDYTQDSWRRYVYNGYQQLCKTIEPEVGSTVMDYDAAGNVAWTASGHALPDTTNCNTAEGYGWGRRVDRTYDARNRLKTLAFPDGNGNQTWTYTPDGLPQQIVTANDGGSNQAINYYTYNRRRLLTGESLEQPGWYNWGIGYGYDGNGNLAGQSYPTGLYIDYAPNALGQATRAGTYAQNVTYHPNGGIARFTYGNGIVHTMAQNARQLPERSTDSGGVLDHHYQYDPAANVTYIGDLAQGSSYSRWMSYDGLDRLTAAGSASFGGDHWHRFTYDALDNMKSWKLAGVKDYANYYYEPGTHRLTNIQNSAGATVVGLGYDVQGNLANKNGQAYVFDYGNRLRAVNDKESYRYDGHGRRLLAWSPLSGTVLSQYANNGQLLYQHNDRLGKGIEHVYLAGSLVAVIDRNWAAGTTVTKYQHTDALGSPVAVTNEAAQVIDRTQYEPYGATINKPAVDGVGYTGHVQDAATGLTYMQQRYYDPGIGRFLSVDPVTANSGTGANFNRYWYANNNPYKFTDPDGRCPVCIGIIVGAAVGFITDYIAQRTLHRDRPVNRKQLAISTLGGMATGGTGAAAVSAVRVGVVTVGEAVAVQTAASGVIGAASAHANAAANGQSATVGEVVASAAGSAAGSLAGSAVGAAAGDFAEPAAQGALQRMASSSAPGLPNIASTTASTGTAVPTQSALQAGASHVGQVAAGATVQVKQEQIMQPKVPPEKMR